VFTRLAAVRLFEPYMHPKYHYHACSYQLFFKHLQYELTCIRLCFGMFWPISTHTPPLWSNYRRGTLSLDWLTGNFSRNPLMVSYKFSFKPIQWHYHFRMIKTHLVSHALNGPILRLSVTSGTWSPPLETCHPSSARGRRRNRLGAGDPVEGFRCPISVGFMNFKSNGSSCGYHLEFSYKKRNAIKIDMCGYFVGIHFPFGNKPSSTFLALGRATRPKVIGGWVPLNEII
jgi:hypothetical protein